MAKVVVYMCVYIITQHRW